MSRSRRLVIGLILAVVAAAAWFLVRRGGTGALDARTAHLTVRWRGRYQGTMTLPARLNWCPGTRRGILEALSGDSGLAIVLYERDSLTNGPHTVLSPDMSSTIQPPGATVVMRWMRLDRDTAVTGFKSLGGTVRVDITNGTGSGDINAWMRSAINLDSLTVQAVFTKVPVVTTAAGCT